MRRPTIHWVGRVPRTGDRHPPPARLRHARRQLERRDYTLPHACCISLSRPCLSDLVISRFLLKSAWRELRHSYNNVARLRWDELETRLRPAPVVSEFHFPVTVAEDALFLAEDGTLTVHCMSTAEYARLLNEAHDGLCSNNITLSAEGRPLAQRRLLGQIARRSWKTVRISCLCVRVTPELLTRIGLDLLKRLLRDNPAARLSIRDALAHPWLKNHKPVYPDVVDVDSKARL